jgi:hypothetical protein
MCHITKLRQKEIDIRQTLQGATAVLIKKQNRPQKLVVLDQKGIQNDPPEYFPKGQRYWDNRATAFSGKQPCR